MTPEDMSRLVAGVLEAGKLEYLNGELRIGNYSSVFAPEHARDAAAVGAEVPKPRASAAPPVVSPTVHPACGAELDSHGWCFRCETTPLDYASVEYRAPRVVGARAPRTGRPPHSGIARN